MRGSAYWFSIFGLKGGALPVGLHFTDRLDITLARFLHCSLGALLVSGMVGTVSSSFEVVVLLYE